MERKIPTFEDTFQLLELPEYLNGTEIRYELNIMTSKKEKAVLIETCRRLQDLYDEICAARFALITSCQVRYPEYLSADTDERGHLWIQSQFVNNAILWYNATFDILLQVIWVYFKLYKLYKKESLSLCNIDKVLSKCNKNNVLGFLPNEDWEGTLKGTLESFDKAGTNLQYIHNFANTLKHRRMIKYEELDKRKHRACFITLSQLPEIVIEGQPPSKQDSQEIKTLYNSNETLQKVKMADVINLLFEYHKEICQLSKFVYDKIEF